MGETLLQALPRMERAAPRVAPRVAPEKYFWFLVELSLYARWVEDPLC
mgnify:CR=1 FL=1